MVGDPARTGDVKGILGKNSRYNKMVNEAMRDEKEFWGTQLNDVLASTVAVKTYGKAMSCMENVLEAQIQGRTAPDEALRDDPGGHPAVADLGCQNAIWSNG